ncbi:MAG: avidin/streptavidin family protein [Beijerinckiaceae bacterium]|jgi:hypothetical protein
MSVDKKSLVPFSLRAAGAPAFNLEGLWHNELGSTMEVVTVSNNNFTGIYTSAVSAGGVSVSGPLSGTIAGDAIGFTVNWKSSSPSVTSWTGLILADAGDVYLYTLWHLASTPGNPSEAWDSISAGADIFVQGPA